MPIPHTCYRTSGKWPFLQCKDLADNFSHPLFFRASGTGLYGDYPTHQGRVQRYKNELVLEPLPDKDNPYPHVTVSAYQPIHGTEDYSLWRTCYLDFSNVRPRQPAKMKDEDEWEELYDMSEEELSCYDLTFPKEKCFPVLLLSYIGLQHGRLFCASLNGKHLVIRQSGIYSFETKAIAPLDFFSRVLLSRPVLNGNAHDCGSHGKAQKKRDPQDDIEPLRYKTRRVTQQAGNG